MRNPFMADLEPLRSRFVSEHAAAPVVQALVDRLERRSELEPRVFLVGGFVRDALLGILAEDVDLEVFGVPAETLESELNALFPGRVHTQGKSFAILQVEIGDGKTIDVAIPRRDSKRGQGHRGFIVNGDPNMDPAEAARRRDFTVNAIMLDAKTWELVDPMGGQADLNDRILRAVDPATFIEDPLRVYRAIQFAARLKMEIDPATLDLLREMVTRGDMSELAPERITDELKKLFLQAEAPSIGFRLLREIGLLQKDYPELAALIGTEQDSEWHPEGDAWTHTLMVVDEAARSIRSSGSALPVQEKLSIMVGALCHDLGKPSTTRQIDGRIRSRGHEEAGKEPVRSLLARWTFGEDIFRAAIVSTAEHLKPVMLFKERERGGLSQEQYANAVRRLVRRIQPVSPEVLLAVSESDWGGRGLPDRIKGEYEAGTAFRQALETLKQNGGLEPLVLGRDLLVLGVPPGERVGEILRAIEHARDEGEVKTRDEALSLARRLVAS